MSKINQKRFGVIGTIGNGSELRNAIFRQPTTHSFHVRRGNEEVAIRYVREFAWDAAGSAKEKEEHAIVTVTKKPILTENAA